MPGHGGSVHVVGRQGAEVVGAPEWRRVTAADESTEVRVLRHASGGISIKLSAGPISMVAAISADDLAFLLAAPVVQMKAA
jgi:1-acyl-sn-glycerol-3-phosphate acyltransferase